MQNSILKSYFFKRSPSRNNREFEIIFLTKLLNLKYLQENPFINWKTMKAKISWFESLGKFYLEKKLLNKLKKF
jgi:hypothetical protein